MVKSNFMKDPRAIFRGFFSPEPEKNKILSTIESIVEPEIDKKVGMAIKLENRVIYPIIQIIFIKNENLVFSAVEIFPIALVVQEADDKYVISLTDAEINQKEFIEMVFQK